MILRPQGHIVPFWMLLIGCRLIVYMNPTILSSILLRLMKTIQKQFGERVRKLRLARNMSQEELAFKAHVHRTYLGGIERGERNPSLKNIGAIAKALEVTVSQLVSFDD